MNIVKNRLLWPALSFRQLAIRFDISSSHCTKLQLISVTACRTWSSARCRYSQIEKDSHVSGESGSLGQRRAGRSSAQTQSSLRRVAVEAERSRGALRQNESGRRNVEANDGVKVVTAVCAAEAYDIPKASSILGNLGYTIDPTRTGLYPQVLHARTTSAAPAEERMRESRKDIFVFPSGTVVAWGEDSSELSKLVQQTLRPAAGSNQLEHLETEDLEYVEDITSEKSKVVGDLIKLGTKSNSNGGHEEPLSTLESKYSLPDNHTGMQHEATLVLTKIAFSSGLAKSVKLAVLEENLEAYFQSTRSIPHMMASGSRLPFTRRFILRKTGELLNARQQLNLNSELTDSLPDIFWDSKYELGLEGYFDQVGRALDVNVRSRVLNQKMDYAQEIVSVLREQLSERHGLKLEWLIIVLIAIEVMFEIHRLVDHYRDAGETEGDGHNKRTKSTIPR